MSAPILITCRTSVRRICLLFSPQTQVFLWNIPFYQKGRKYHYFFEICRRLLRTQAIMFLFISHSELLFQDHIETSLINKMWICLTCMGEFFVSCDSMKRNLLRSSPLTDFHKESEELSPEYFEVDFTSFEGSCAICDHYFTKFCNRFRISSS